MRCSCVIPGSVAIALLLIAGCNLAGPNRNYDAELAHYKQLAHTVEHQELTTPPSQHAGTMEPRTIDHNAAPQAPQEWWDLTIEEAIQLAVTRSSVLRDLGGTIVRSPETVRTILAPAQVASDPRFGMEAALSDFDATIATSVVAEKNDRMTNNFVATGGTRFFNQDLINFQSQISKLGATGTRTTLRGTSVYDFNNASFNRFPGTWDTLVDAEFRMPLYQGAGARFNRLAGPNAVPGFYNGVLIARVNTDISVADFEIGLRDLISNVENAYWDLYFAFRDLDAKLTARDAALKSWTKVKTLLENEQGVGLLEREAQAREQYFRYEEDVQNALAGTLQSATTNNNGSSGGSFRGVGGVLVSERRLRLAIGLPITDGQMIRPIDEPTLARVEFDWPTASGDAIARRPELLRQRLTIKRREMEYVAARNFLLPRFDLLGRYRFRGLGQNLIGDINLPADPADPDGLFERSSLANLAGGNFQEWQLGGEVSLPVGFRRGYAGVRNAQLSLAREKAVLEEQERQIIHDLSNALGDMRRAYQIMETTYNRRLAAQQNTEILNLRLEQDQPVNPEQLLESHRRLAEADIQYHRALVEHILAIKNVHFEKGTLLEYGRIQLAEQMPLATEPMTSEPVASPPPQGNLPTTTAPSAQPLLPQPMATEQMPPPAQAIPPEAGRTIGAIPFPQTPAPAALPTRPRIMVPPSAVNSPFGMPTTVHGGPSIIPSSRAPGGLPPTANQWIEQTWFSRDPINDAMNAPQIKIPAVLPPGRPDAAAWAAPPVLSPPAPLPFVSRLPAPLVDPPPESSLSRLPAP